VSNDDTRRRVWLHCPVCDEVYSRTGLTACSARQLRHPDHAGMGKLEVCNGAVHNFGPEAHRQAFAQLWDGINGERAPWAANPYVWRVEFRKVDGVGNTCAERGSK
jgi:hypothetical protein